MSSLKVAEKEYLTFHIDICEDLWFEVEFPGKHKKYMMSAIYRHPCNNNNTFIDARDENLQTLNNKHNKEILMGDFNFDLSGGIDYLNLSAAKYLNMIESNAFTNLINKPTRVR